MRRKVRHKLDLEDKDFAMRRLETLRKISEPLLDDEERDHSDEVLRIIRNVPAIYFRGFGDFQGPEK